MAQPMQDSIVSKPLSTSFKLYHRYEEDLNHYPSAGFKIRVLATLLDGIFYAVLTGVIDALMDGTYEFLRETSPGAYFILTLCVSSILVGYYYAWPVSEWGATPGKKLLGIKIISKTENGKVGFWKAYNRCIFGYSISLLLFCTGFLRIIWRKDKLALHDALFNTRVILCKK